MAVRNRPTARACHARYPQIRARCLCCDWWKRRTALALRQSASSTCRSHELSDRQDVTVQQKSADSLGGKHRAFLRLLAREERRSSGGGPDAADTTHALIMACPIASPRWKAALLIVAQRPEAMVSRGAGRDRLGMGHNARREALKPRARRSGFNDLPETSRPISPPRRAASGECKPGWKALGPKACRRAAAVRHT